MGLYNYIDPIGAYSIGPYSIGPYTELSLLGERPDGFSITTILLYFISLIDDLIILLSQNPMRLGSI